MSVDGTKRTSQPNCLMSAFGGKADIVFQGRNPFPPKATSAECEPRLLGVPTATTSRTREMLAISRRRARRAV